MVGTTPNATPHTAMRHRAPQMRGQRVAKIGVIRIGKIIDPYKYGFTAQKCQHGSNKPLAGPVHFLEKKI